MAPNDIQVLIPGTCEYYFIWEKDLRSCDDVKDLGMKRLIWFILHAVTCVHNYKREAEENLTR